MGPAPGPEVMMFETGSEPNPEDGNSFSKTACQPGAMG
jgi:hypothetical protein